MVTQTKQATLGEVVEAYLFDLQAAGRSPLTIESYDSTLRALVQFLQAQNVKDWTSISQGILRQFLAARLGDGLKASTIRQRATAISCFFNWLVQEGLIDSNPMLRVRRPQKPQRLVKPFSRADLLAIFQAVEETFDPIRNKAILSLFLDCGLRVSELLSLKPSSYDRGTTTLTVKGKGRKVRRLRLGQRSREAFEAHLDRANGQLWDVTRESLADLIHRLGRRVGVHAYPHKFRHTFACRFLDAGGAIDELQYLMGHSHIATTMIYAAAGQEERALRSHAAHSPLDALA